MTFTVKSTHLVAVAVAVVVGFLIMATVNSSSQAEIEDESGFNCSYIKIAADDGDRDAQEFYNNNC